MGLCVGKGKADKFKTAARRAHILRELTSRLAVFLKPETTCT
jgi:hypothetical protein